MPPPVNNIPLMIPCPLFGWRTTNFVDNDNITILVECVRGETTLEVIKFLMKAAMDKFVILKIQSRNGHHKWWILRFAIDVSVNFLI